MNIHQSLDQLLDQLNANGITLVELKLESQTDRDKLAFLMKRELSVYALTPSIEPRFVYSYNGVVLTHD